MNNKFKLFIVAIVSFLLGMMATTLYRIPSQNEENRKLVSTIISEKKIIAEKKPFFVKVKEGGNKILNSFTISHKEEIIQSQQDFINLSNKLTEFSDRSFTELRKKFVTSDPQDKDLTNVRRQQHLKNSLESMFMQNELWYKVIVDDELTKTKFFIFYHYETCDRKKPRPGMDLKDICYDLLFNVLNNNKMRRTSSGSSMSYSLYYNDSPYVRVMFDSSGEMTEATKAIMAVIPIPNEQYPIQLLQFNSGQFNWREGSEVKWLPSSEKEFKKFNKWAEGEGFKHSDSYDE